MSRKHRKNQMELAFGTRSSGEAASPRPGGNELHMAEGRTESPVETGKLMEEILERENLKRALVRVKSNKGSAGIDGLTVYELTDYLRENWAGIKEELLTGKYKPTPVKRVEIPKPGGGVRNLGIPTVLDRFIQQAILQVLQKMFDPMFSDHSYGFRPGRSAHKAIARAQEYISSGHDWVVDIDLEKFFDRVNHDRLMARLVERIQDKRLLKLIRAYLNAGVMINGLVSPTTEGTPQGGPLSPLLSNIVLDELDRELERRGHRFVRYADDCNIYVRSERAGYRVMESVKHFIGKKLKLRVNEKKSAVSQPVKRKFLGFSFTFGEMVKRRIAPESIARFKVRIREITRRNRGISLERMIQELNDYLRGWNAYFGFCQTQSVLETLNSWVRRRLRSYQWKLWKRGKVRYAELRKLGIGKDLAAQTAGSNHSIWRISHSPALSKAMHNAFFEKLGLFCLQIR